VEAVGSYGVNVTESGDTGLSLERARACSKPSIVNVMLNSNVCSSGTRNLTMFR
jgi:hypothetical protein